MRFALLLALSLLLAAPARADEWTQALITDLVERKAKDALAQYEAVIAAKHSQARDASLRRLFLLARRGDTKGLVAEAERFLKTWPDAPAKRFVSGIQAKPQDYVRQVGGDLKKRLKTQRVSLNFNGTPLGDALGFLQDVSGVGFLLLPDADASKPVTAQLKDVSLASALEQLLSVDGDLETKPFAGMVVIGKSLGGLRPHRWTKAEVQADPSGALLIASRRVTLNFPSTPLSEVVQFLADITGLKLRLDDEVAASDPSVRLRVRQVTLEAALALCLRPHGLEFSLDARGLRIRKSP